MWLRNTPLHSTYVNLRTNTKYTHSKYGSWLKTKPLCSQQRWILSHSDRLRKMNKGKRKVVWPTYMYLDVSKYNNYIISIWVKRGI